MLIELSVENFRSIRHRQTLSMVAAPRLSKKQNTFTAQLPGEKFPSLLKATAIYGPNASGKSTLIRAFRVVSDLARGKRVGEKEYPAVSPFRFDTAISESPSRFEIHFIEKGVRYHFCVALTSERIMEESLTAYVRGSEKSLYSRKHENGRDVYDYGSLEGGWELNEAWRKLTGPRVLFIVQAVANSNEELQQLRPPLSWLSGLMIEDHGLGSTTNVAKRIIADVPSVGDEIAQLLSDVDVPIAKIQSKVIDGSAGDMLSAEETRQFPETTKSMFKALFSQSDVVTTLTHKTVLGEVEFDFEDESEGTKNLLGFALPWFLFRNSPNSSTGILIVDEIDSSLHPKLVEALVQRHLSGKIPCQLIFTTHDTHLMDTKLLRRDQIWMTERDETGATQLRSVYDFEGREGEDIEKRYFEGRYRSLPIIRRG
jgi:AAA15 family ATPase/GTPase